MCESDQQTGPDAEFGCTYCGARPAFEEIGEGMTLAIVLYRCKSCLLKEMDELEGWWPTSKYCH